MAWSKVIPIAVDPTKVSGGADLANFTFPIAVTHTQLRTIANGGLVTDGTKDAAVFADSGCLTLLKFHRVSYDAVNGTWVGWVKLPVLSATLPSFVYLGYGNSAISSDQSDKANAWDANTKLAKPGFGDGTTLDLTEHSGSFTFTNTAATASAGLIGGAASFNGTTAFMEHASTAPVSTYPMTIEVLFKPSASVATTQVLTCINERANATAIPQGIRARATDAVRAQAGGTTDTQTANGVLNSTNWHYASATFTSSTARGLSVDGAADVSGTAAATITATIDNVSIGAELNTNAANSFFSGLINTVIYSDAVRSIGWRVTRYNATVGIATFTTTGSPQDVNASAASANTALVTAMGGDSVLIAAYDRRLNVGVVSSKVATWDDAIGTYGGRTPGPQLAQATAGVRPAFSGTQGSGSESITLTAASSQTLVSAADSRFSFVGTFAAPKPLWLLVIGTASGNGELANLSADPTSTTTYPYARIRTASSNWGAACASDGATATPTNPPIPNTAGIFTSDSGTGWTGGAVRAMCVGKLGYQTLSGDQGTNINHVWGYLSNMGGKQPRFMHRVTAATAGSCKLSVGRFGTTYIDGTISWVGVLSGEMTLARLQAFQAFAVAQFGATIDAVALPNLCVVGNSIVMSTTQQSGGDMQSPTNTSGTTSFPYYMANKTSGARGSLVTQGILESDVHAYAWGRSGGTYQDVIDAFDYEVALLADARRTGPIVVVAYDVNNALATRNSAQYLTLAAALKTKCDALATASGRTVTLIHVLEADRGDNYNASYPTIPSGYSTTGTNRVSVGTTMLASPTTYGAVVYDAATLSGLQLGTFAAPKCYNATNYNITANGGFGGGDTTHMAPAGYQILGEGIKANVFDVTDTLLYPVSSALRLRRRRR